MPLHCHPCSWDATIGGTRFVQWALGYPHEQRQWRGGGEGWLPRLLYDTQTHQLASPKSCYWSDHYATFVRDPANVIPAPWVNSS